MKKFELSLTKDYASDWGLQEALRELIQNAIDQEYQSENENTMTLSYDGKDLLTISNKESILSTQSLLLGYTSKLDDSNCIGSFGEGYKIALLVLNRLNKKVTIKNYGNKEVWNSRFVKSRKYGGVEILTVFVDTDFFWEKKPDSNLTIEVQGISPQDYETLVDRTLYLKSDLGEILHSENYGDILLDKSEEGRIYVKGLYITTIKELNYGYNILPNRITIGRDRNLVSDFNILQVTSKMWGSQNNHLLQSLINKNCKDVYYLSSSIEYYLNIDNGSQIKNGTYESFLAEYGENSIPVSSQFESDSVKLKYKNVHPIFVNDLRKDLIIKSESFKKTQETNFAKREIQTEEAYFLWKHKNRNLISDNVFSELEEIICGFIDFEKVEQIRVNYNNENEHENNNLF